MRALADIAGTLSRFGMRAQHALAIGALVVLGACANTKSLPGDPNATRQEICHNAAMGKAAGGSAREEAIRLAMQRGFVRENQVDLIRASKVALGMNTCEVLAAWGNPIGAETFTNESGKTTTYWYKAGGRLMHTVRFDAQGLVYWMSSN